MSTWNYHYVGLIAGFFAIFMLDATFIDSFVLYFIVTTQLLIQRMVYAEKNKEEETK